LSANNLSEAKPGIFTSYFVLEDDYDYLFYQKTLLNSGKSTSESMTCKNSLQFQDPIQTYTR